MEGCAFVYLVVPTSVAQWRGGRGGFAGGFAGSLPEPAFSFGHGAIAAEPWSNLQCLSACHLCWVKTVGAASPARFADLWDDQTGFQRVPLVLNIPPPALFAPCQQTSAHPAGMRKVRGETKAALPLQLPQIYPVS